MQLQQVCRQKTHCLSQGSRGKLLLPNEGFEDAGRVRALDAEVQTAFCSHQTVPERCGLLLSTSSAGNTGLNGHTGSTRVIFQLNQGQIESEAALIESVQYQPTGGPEPEAGWNCSKQKL